MTRRTHCVTDDLGHAFQVARPLRRVVSLVPSLTQAVAPTGLLVGATDWCTHPSDLDVVRVRGTKNPDRAMIGALAPDLVIANKEENRELDVRRLREAGVPVWVTQIETVPESIASMKRLFIAALELELPTWLREAEALWAGEAPAPRARVAVPVWRDPWMVVGRGTFTGDLLRRAGLVNVFGAEAERYPRVNVERINGPGIDVVLLPDEPYVFTSEDGPEVFVGVPTELVNGRLLTWYGPSLVEAHSYAQKVART